MQSMVAKLRYADSRMPHSPATLNVTGSHPNSATFLRFISRVTTVSGTEGLKMVCVTLQELTVTSNVCVDNW